MQVVPYDEQHVRRAIRTVIGNALRSYYAELLKEAIPSRLAELLRRFDEPDRGCSETQEELTCVSDFGWSQRLKKEEPVLEAGNLPRV